MSICMTVLLTAKQSFRVIFHTVGGITSDNTSHYPTTYDFTSLSVEPNIRLSIRLNSAFGIYNFF